MFKRSHNLYKDNWSLTETMWFTGNKAEGVGGGEGGGDGYWGGGDYVSGFTQLPFPLPAPN